MVVVALHHPTVEPEFRICPSAGCQGAVAMDHQIVRPLLHVGPQLGQLPAHHINPVRLLLAAHPNILDDGGSLDKTGRHGKGWHRIRKA